MFQVPKSIAQISYAITNCSLGLMLVAATQDNCIQAIHFGDTIGEVKCLFEKQYWYNLRVEAPIDLSNLVKYVDNPLKYSPMLSEFKLGMYDKNCTTLQAKVLRLILETPAGTTISYSELAQKAGLPNSSRAVANACGSNNIAVLIPCHRVIRSDGNISGYRWGQWRKKALLDKEGYNEIHC